MLKENCRFSGLQWTKWRLWRVFPFPNILDWSLHLCRNHNLFQGKEVASLHGEIGLAALTAGSMCSSALSGGHATKSNLNWSGALLGYSFVSTAATALTKKRQIMLSWILSSLILTEKLPTFWSQVCPLPVKQWKTKLCVWLKIFFS